eukprot:12431769-Alexandrium_andersonii.AAC.1
MCIRDSPSEHAASVYSLVSDIRAHIWSSHVEAVVTGGFVTDAVRLQGGESAELSTLRCADCGNEAAPTRRH